MKKSLERKNSKVVRKVAMSCAIAAVMTLYLPVMALAGDYDIDEGSVDIHAYEDRTEVTHKNETRNDSSPNVYSSSGQTTQNTVTITADNNATANVTLSGVNINTREDPDDEDTSGPAAVSVNGAGNVNIELEGNNYLTGGLHHAGLEDHLSGTLTINDANNNGLLSANGGWEAAGIGGGEDENGSYITINGGTITATGGTLGAGIGGGSDGDGNNIIINGGNVTAIGGDNAAGIGGGDSGGGRNITITGGVVIAACGNDTGAGIGGGMDGNGSAITISGSAQVSAAGGEFYDEYAQAGAAIGDGGSEVMGAEAEIDTTNLYTNGSIKKYAPGSTAEAIAAGTAVQVGDTVVGTADPPAEQEPEQEPEPLPAPRRATVSVITADENYASTAAASVADTDAAFFAAVDMQIDDLLKEINALIAEGRLDEAKALIEKGLAINAGTHQGFNAATLAKLGEASSMGIAVTVNFTYGGASYSVTIPGNSQIDPAALVDENGYCGFLNLLKYFK